MSTAAKTASSVQVGPAKMAPADPDSISKADKVKLMKVYKRLCPDDLVTPDDPRYNTIAAEVLDIGRAPTFREALEIVGYWKLSEAWSHEFAESVRRSFARMKLEFGRAMTANGPPRPGAPKSGPRMCRAR